MNIYEALKLEDIDIRLTNDAMGRWLVWRTAINQWAVYEKKRYARMTGCLYCGDSCEKAISYLIEGETND